MKPKKRLQAPSWRSSPSASAKEAQPLDLALALTGQARSQIDLVERLIRWQHELTSENAALRARIAELEAARQPPREPGPTPEPGPAPASSPKSAAAPEAPPQSRAKGDAPAPADFPAALYTFSEAEKRYPAFSPAAEALTGLRASELARSGAPLLERLQPASDPLGQPGEPPAGHEVRFHRYTHPDGRMLLLRDQRRRTGTDDEPTLFSGVLADWTPVEAAVAALREEASGARRQLEAKTDFLAEVTHELRTPVNAILGLAEVLTEATAPAEIEDCTQKLQRNCRFLLTLVNDVLDLARLESGHFELVPEPTALAELVEDVAELFRQEADEKGLALESRVDPALPETVHVDPLRLRQVLVNLVSNAVKFTEEGRVSLRLSQLAREDAHIELECVVEDTGIGIPEHRLQAIFEPYEQGDRETGRVFGGSGLGLAIARNLAEALGGTLQASSEPGKGSLFRLRLRTAIAGKATPAKTGPPPARPAPMAPSGTAVLLVEDDPMNRDLIARRLKKRGYRVESARDGRDALERLRGEPFEIVVLDRVLPDLDGFELARLVRSQSEERGSPAPALIAVSGRTDPNAASQADEAGIEAYLTKPLDYARLDAALAAALEKRRDEPPPGEPPRTPAEPEARLSERFGHIDVGEIEKIMDGEDKHEFLAQAISVFLESTPNLLGNLQKAVEPLDRSTLSRLAHSLKSNAQLLGAAHLGELSERLEKEAHSESPEKLDRLTGEILREYRDVSHELEIFETEVAPSGKDPSDGD